jgi:hypothetical protein
VSKNKVKPSAGYCEKPYPADGKTNELFYGIFAYEA